MATTWFVEPLSAAEVGDVVDEILGIERASFSNPWTRDMYLAELANERIARLFVARGADRRIVGFCAIRLVVDELHINNLGVAPEHRRVGVGSTLLAHVLEEGRRLGARSVILEVRRSNDVARHLYERFGFSLAGVRRAYYSRPTEDALILRRACE